MSYDDAWIEDSVSWVCPTCGMLNRSPADDMQCRRSNCAEQFDSDSFDWDSSDERVMQIVDDMLKDFKI